MSSDSMSFLRAVVSRALGRRCTIFDDFYCCYWVLTYIVDFHGISHCRFEQPVGLHNGLNRFARGKYGRFPLLYVFGYETI